MDNSEEMNDRDTLFYSGLITPGKTAALSMLEQRYGQNDPPINLDMLLKQKLVTSCNIDHHFLLEKGLIVGPSKKIK